MNLFQKVRSFFCDSFTKQSTAAPVVTEQKELPEYAKAVQKAAQEFRARHPQWPCHISCGRRSFHRRGTSEFAASHIIVLGYGELAAEIEDSETLRVVRWKFGDGVHTWDELPDIPGPEYAVLSVEEVCIIPRESSVQA